MVCVEASGKHGVSRDCQIADLYDVEAVRWGAQAQCRDLDVAIWHALDVCHRRFCYKGFLFLLSAGAGQRLFFSSERRRGLTQLHSFYFL